MPPGGVSCVGRAAPLTCGSTAAATEGVALAS